MDFALTALSGVAWTIVYIEAIRLGFAQKTYAMPIAALGLNIAWEWLYAFHGFATAPGALQTWVNLVWGLGDCVILFTYFRFGRREFPQLTERLGSWAYIAWGIAMVVTAAIVQWLFTVQFGFDGSRAAAYSAFLQNLLMSGLFIGMFVARGGSRGQSLVIAFAKWIGTLAPTIQLGWVDGAWPFVVGIGLLCSAFDLTYIALLAWDRTRVKALARAS